MDPFSRLAVAPMTAPKVIMGAGAPAISMIALDLDNAEQAIALARLLARQTGRNVTVRDSDGNILDTVQAAAKN
jgi:hypothetical protein